MGRLEGKVAIVTGGGRGIGRGIALALAKEGAMLAVADIDFAPAEEVAEEIRRLGNKAIGLSCDVGKEEQVKSMVVRVVKELGPIDILANVAQSFGGRSVSLQSKPIEEMPEEWWDMTFQSGLKGTWYCCKAVLPHMKGRGGKIINIGSGSGVMGMAGTVDYNCCKEAIRAFTRTAAREWGQYGINVNVICPSANTRTAMYWTENPPEFTKMFHSHSAGALGNPISRKGDPEKDIGRVAVFLASADSDYMTGHTFMVNGGLFMNTY